VAEIKIEGSRLVPVFMISAGDGNGPAGTSTDPEFRTMVWVVGLTMQNTNTTISVAGHPLWARLARSRR
jgi:hypothetical protein